MPFNLAPLNPDRRQRLLTQNQMGFAHLLPLKVTQQLYQQAFQEKGRYADIGAAYGIDTFQLLQAGAHHVTAIDINTGHLQFLEKNLSPQEAARLEICCQHFPEECHLLPSFYDGILLSRVLIFLTPHNTHLALHQIYQALKPGGKVYIITISPFSQNWEPIAKLFEDHSQVYPDAPLFVSHLWERLPFTQSFLPNQIQIFDEPSLRYQLEKARFKVVESGYEEHYGSVDTFSIAQKTV